MAFIRTARLSHLYGRFGRVHRALLEHPSGRFLERAIYSSLDDAEKDGALELLRAHAPPTLASIVVEDGVTLPGLLRAVPTLRQLVVGGVIDGLGEVEAPALEELRLGWTDGRVLAKLAEASWPVLKRLHPTYSQPERGTFIEILRGVRMPVLEHITIRRWMIREIDDDDVLEEEEDLADMPLLTQDAFALELARGAAARRLAQLDLEMPISTAGARALLANIEMLRAIRAIRVPSASIDKTVRTALSKVHPGLRWTKNPEEENLDLMPIDTGPLFVRE